jgi:hypothetical protein
MKTRHNQKRALKVGCLIGFGFLVLVLFFLVQVSNPICWLWNCLEDEKHSLASLDIPDDHFPALSKIGTFSDNSQSPSIEEASKTVYWNDGNGLAIYIVEKYSSESEATQKFLGTKDSLFSRYEDAVAVPFVSRIANSYEVQCGNQPNFGYRCGFVAQYGAYFVMFNSIIDNEMSTEEFDRIILFVDFAISQKLTGFSD